MQALRENAISQGFIFDEENRLCHGDSVYVVVGNGADFTTNRGELFDGELAYFITKNWRWWDNLTESQIAERSLFETKYNMEKWQCAYVGAVKKNTSFIIERSTKYSDENIRTDIPIYKS